VRSRPGRTRFSIRLPRVATAPRVVESQLLQR
jgi:hypothetical protein